MALSRWALVAFLVCLQQGAHAETLGATPDAAAGAGGVREASPVDATEQEEPSPDESPAVPFSLFAWGFKSTDLVETQAEKDGVGQARGWLWVAFIFYMFLAQEHVCEKYFCASIDVIVERARLAGSPFGEEAVAGATLVALGCNGPELFTNLVSCVSGGSDLGVGTIIGSEIFNLLVIFGSSVLAAPVLPLQIEKAPFVRDCFFYGLSIISLGVCLQDEQIEWYESLGLFGFAAVYTFAVYSTSRVVSWFSGGNKDESLSEPLTNEANGSDSPSRVESAGSPAGSPKRMMSRMLGYDVEVMEVVHSRWADVAAHKTETSKHLNFAKGEERSDGDDMPRPRRSSKGGSYGMKIEGEDFLEYDALREVITMEKGIIELEFRPDESKHVALRIKCENSVQRDELLASIKGHWDKAWIHKYDATVIGALKHVGHILADPKETLQTKIFEIIGLPIDVALSSTLFIVDVKDITKEDRWLGCFIGSMAWLATFSYILVLCADVIQYYFGVPQIVLGITLAAVGTSFPNAVASVIMARQGRSGVAISNALGSNVQNIFLALAVPWIIVTIFPVIDYPDGQTWLHNFPMKAQGLKEGTYWMLGTLTLVVVFVGPSFTLVKWQAYALFATYIAYLFSAVPALTELVTGAFGGN